MTSQNISSAILLLFALVFTAPLWASDIADNQANNSDFKPIYAAPPMYPTQAVVERIEGFVVVGFTVTKDGSVKDPVVIDASPEGVFDRSALRAVKRFKYRPRVVDGVAQDTPGVNYKFTFALSKP
ncbi:MAG: energy transducer TonB [Cellvibrionaceae bacterium]